MRGTLKYVSVAIIALLAFSLYFFFEEYHSYYKGFSGEKKVRIEKGSSIEKIADLLKEEGVIRSSRTFLLFYSLFFKGRPLQAGLYSFGKPMRTIDVLRKLVNGEISKFRVSVPEGLTIEETAKLFSNYIPGKEFLKETKDSWLIEDLDPQAKDLEGYLFPDTYIFPEGIPASEVIKEMVSNFRKKFSISLRERADSMGWKIRDIVTLASLIEKETSKDDEKPIISSVFHNRFRMRMPLQCDPTVIYAMKKMGIWKGRLLRNYYKKVKSPYNTYLHRGLPPGPICSPGLNSIRAALYPASTDYLYFIAIGKSHIFSKTYSQHLEILESKR